MFLLDSGPLKASTHSKTKNLINSSQRICNFRKIHGKEFYILSQYKITKKNNKSIKKKKIKICLLKQFQLERLKPHFLTSSLHQQIL